jgi:hypothetical protein
MILGGITMPTKLKPAEVKEFQDAIRHMHGCESKYVKAVDVHEKVPEGQPLAGQSVWEGTVHEFKLVRHPKAATCYAWRYFNEDSGRWNYVAVLHDGPVDSPTRAVQGYIVTAYRKGDLG